MQLMLGTGLNSLLCAAMERQDVRKGMQLARRALRWFCPMQVLLCGAGQAGSELGFLASARVLARLNAVSGRVFPLPPALARVQGQGSRGGSPGAQPPAERMGPATASAGGAPAHGEGRDLGEATGSIMAAAAPGCGGAAGSCEGVRAGAGRTEGSPKAERGNDGEPAGPDTPLAASAPAKAMGKVLCGRLLMRLCWSGAAGMEVDTSECPTRLNVGVQPASS